MSRKHLTPIGVLSQATDPTGANSGDIYFNTTIGCYKQYTGSAWVNLVAQPTDGLAGGRVFTGDTTPTGPVAGDLWVDSTGFSSGANILRWRKTASGGETSFSGLDDLSIPLSYTVGYEEVYLNGVLLVRAVDYVATTGTSITGLTALTANDVVTVIAPQNMVYGDYFTQAQVTALLALTTPVGTVNPYAGAAAPSNWVLCDGSQYPQTGTYAALYAVVGTTYNTGGETSGYFRVPDLRGRAIAGKDNMGGTAANRITSGNSGVAGTTLGASGGNELLHSHNHAMNVYNTAQEAANYGLATSAQFRDRVIVTSVGSGFATSAAGGGASQNIQPTIILNYIIKAA